MEPSCAGWLTNPKKAAYNRVNSRTTRGCLVVLLGIPAGMLALVAAVWLVAASA